MTAERRAALLDWLAKGPFAIAAAALQGGMNYVIVLYLTFEVGLAATGEYRTLFSCYSLLALASMIESNKVYLRSVVARDRDAATAILVNRIVFAVGAFAVLLVVWAAGRGAGRTFVPDVLVVIAFISAVGYPFDLYIPDLQARRRFQRLFVVEITKYGTAFVVFVAMIGSGRSITEAVLALLAVLATCHILFFATYSRHSIRLGAVPGRLRALVRSEPAAQSRTYSFAGMIPASMEHIDKLLVGHIFGLALLGVYTLAYSTGRFLYNTLKPAMYVYYRRFVDTMPGRRLLRRVALIFTLLGASSAAVFLIAIELIPGLHAFREGRWATVILFLGYGIGIVSAIYTQAFMLNAESVAAHAFRANLLATAASAVVLAVALAAPPAAALVLLALQSPVRDGLQVLLMARFRRRAL